MKSSPTINAMEIVYGCFYMRASKLVVKGTTLEGIEDARKEYKKNLKKDSKDYYFKSYF